MPLDSRFFGICGHIVKISDKDPKYKDNPKISEDPKLKHNLKNEEETFCG